MSHLKDICKLLVILAVLAAIFFGIYRVVKSQETANRTKYRHPIHQVGGQW
ncbi:hypothetical protein EDC39_10418 [Geothermobacter ehrlichii]|uniref:Uncharacterized protein n=1 Tax=Geothermobacter ehrlichii TaxID=213224 RepID=A0A5D3WKX1_9BACT|nr:hypothetical protein [Geothermobacter ehrlichii]TYO98895.1 hypothetical protein EDC39_10418 [Geothermobacter ehrlichii]